MEPWEHTAKAFDAIFNAAGLNDLGKKLPPARRTDGEVVIEDQYITFRVEYADVGDRDALKAEAVNVYGSLDDGDEFPIPLGSIPEHLLSELEAKCLADLREIDDSRRETSKYGDL